MITDESFDVSGQRALVLGASGNVGACVTRHLVAGGADVRVLVRPTSSTRGIDGLDIDVRVGDVFDPSDVESAIADREVVYHCVVDTRAELRDPSPLFATNVDGLRTVLEAASAAAVQRFVFLSTIGTVAIDSGASDTARFVDEDTPFNWRAEGGSYIESRLQAEELVLSYVASRRLRAVIANVSNPYGPPDWEPRQGRMVKAAALGGLPFYLRGVGAEVVGIDDAAQAILRMSRHGRIGERYIISERFMSQQELVTVAARAVGRRPPRIGISMRTLGFLARLADIASMVTEREPALNTRSARLLSLTSPASHRKASDELEWNPRPTEEFIARAATAHVERSRPRSPSTND